MIYKKYFYKCYGPYVGCEQTGIIEAIDIDEANDVAYQIAYDNYHAYPHTDEEDGVESEYDYYVEEYNPEEHDSQI